MSVSVTTVRLDTGLKQEAQALFSNLGMDMSTAINIFLRQSVREQAIPFRVGAPVPNAATRTALEELKTMEQYPEAYKAYDSAEDMVRDILG